MFSTSAFFRLCSVFFYFTGFFPFGKIRFQEEDIFLAVFSFLFSGCCFRNFFLGIFPGICYDDCRAFWRRVCDTGVTDAVLQSACESKKRVRIKI
jgi:hypothetical protein